MRHALHSFVMVCCISVCCGCMTFGPKGKQSTSRSEFLLAREGAPACTIVLSEDPTPAVRLAAMELQFHVMKITGAELPVRTDKDNVTGPRVLIGDSAAAREVHSKRSESKNRDSGERAKGRRWRGF